MRTALPTDSSAGPPLNWDLHAMRQALQRFLAYLVRRGSLKRWYLLLEEMGSLKMLTLEAFKISIRAFAAGWEMKKCLGIFQMMKKHRFHADLSTFNGLLDSLVKAKLAKEAKMLFEKMKDQFPPDLQTYTILLFGWCKMKNLVEAGKVWNEMLDDGFKSNIAAHNVMLEGLIRGQRRPEA
jgi:pentatricopeptide repeat protein